MSQGPTPTGMAGAASNPSTDAETLREIAYHYPELRAAVAANPSAYPGLLTWLGELGDPAVDEALAARAVAGRPTASTPPAFAPGSADTTAAWERTASGAPQGTNAPQWSAPSSGTQVIADGLDRSTARTEDTRQPSSRALRVVLVALLVVAAVLILLVALIFNGVFDTGNEGASPQQSNPSASQTPSSSDSTSGSDTPTPSTSTVAYPAPAGAITATQIAAPSGNIACTLSGDTVTCTIFSSDYASKGYGTCGDTTTLTADSTSAGLGCGTTVSDGATPLAYGSTATSGTVACTSTEQGMSCWNTVSGQSFALARGGWQTGRTGQIAPENFTW